MRVLEICQENSMNGLKKKKNKQTNKVPAVSTEEQVRKGLDPWTLQISPGGGYYGNHERYLSLKSRPILHISLSSHF